MTSRAIIFFLFAFVQSANLQADIVRITDADLLGFPTVITDAGDVYSGVDAEAVLFEEMQTPGRVENLEKRATDGDVSSAEILCALADRVMPPSNAVRIRRKMLEVYLGITEKRFLEEDARFVFPADAAENWGPVLRFYLFRFARFERIRAFPLFTDRQSRLVLCRGMLAELIFCGESPVMKFLIQKIRESDDPEGGLFLDYVSNANIGMTGIDFRTDATKTEARKNQLGKNNILVRLYDSDSLSKTNPTSAYQNLALLAREEHCYPAYFSVMQLFRSDRFNMKRTTEMLQEYAYFAYLQTRSYPSPIFLMNRYAVAILLEYYLGVKDFETAATIVAFLSETKNAATTGSAIAKWISESEPVMASYLNQRVWAMFGKSPKQMFSEAWKRGETMAKQGYYENEEFEKRFQDSLRERAKELKAPREIRGNAPVQRRY